MKSIKWNFIFVFQKQLENATSEDIFLNDMNLMDPQLSTFVSLLPIYLSIILIFFLLGFNLKNQKCCKRPNDPFANIYVVQPAPELELESEATLEVELKLDSDFESVSISASYFEDDAFLDDVFLDGDSIASTSYLIQ